MPGRGCAHLVILKGDPKWGPLTTCPVSPPSYEQRENVLEGQLKGADEQQREGGSEGEPPLPLTPPL